MVNSVKCVDDHLFTQTISSANAKLKSSSLQEGCDGFSNFDQFRVFQLKSLTGDDGPEGVGDRDVQGSLPTGKMDL